MGKLNYSCFVAVMNLFYLSMPVIRILSFSHFFDDSTSECISRKGICDFFGMVDFISVTLDLSGP